MTKKIMVLMAVLALSLLLAIPGFARGWGQQAGAGQQGNWGNSTHCGQNYCPNQPNYGGQSHCQQLYCQNQSQTNCPWGYR